MRYFNVSGPCFKASHYMIDPATRLKGVEKLIDRNQYFVIYAARQSGKTTYLQDLAARLNAAGTSHALYCSLEGIQGITNVQDGIPAVVKTLKNVLSQTDIPGGAEFARDADYTDYTNVLNRALALFCRILARPLVILFDEVDCLSEGTLVTFLRQLRLGYNNRGMTPFVHSIALVGMRNIRDYQAQIRPDSESLGTASPFNIVTEAFTLRNFTREEIIDLYSQHTAATGQKFNTNAIELIVNQTAGQPWLVNAVARESVENILDSVYTKPVTVEVAEQAIQNIILRRDTHIDSLLARLREERVRRVIEPMILGDGALLDKTADDFYLVHDLGLIRTDRGRVEPANPIYGEVIARTLAFNYQDEIKTSGNPEYQIPRYLKDGGIDLDFLLSDFQQFWRENSEIWVERFQYKEAAPHLILMAFLQRVINGGGLIIREMALGTKEVLICVWFIRTFVT